MEYISARRSRNSSSLGSTGKQPYYAAAPTLFRMNNQQQPDLYQPGTQLTVGSHKVVVNKYFSHGGFAQVYTCTISPPWNNKQVACLKRVNVPDKGSLNTLRKEVDAMRKLQGINCIVSYIDSHAARSNNGNGAGYEVFVLMEYCSRKGLIDFMNTRLVNKLTEPEILVIVQQITEAVAHMHALNPPLIHRDIKIENVLLGDDGTYKLCDFGSVSLVINPPTNVEEFQVIQDDIMKNTTPQYRCPEMLDLYKRQPIDEKSDVWALGVFLYKLCYYTTPFEQNSINGNVNGYGGDYAIINGIYSFPSLPPYSARLKNVIAKLLTVDPNLRPNTFQLLDEISKLRGVPCPVIQKAPSIQYHPISMQTGPSGSVASFNNMSTVNPRPKIVPSSVTGVNNSLSGRAEGSAFKYSGLKDAINSNLGRNGITNTPVDSPKELVPPKVRSSRRPISMYGNSSLNRKGSRESLDIQNFMNELSNEEVVNLSPPAESESISSSVDYLKSISRQNTNSSHYNNSGSRHPSRSKKRSSITSIKNLLTGGSSKSQHTSTVPASQPSRSNSTRKSSTYSNKRNSSIDSLTDSHQKFKNMNSSLSDLQEMSPESKTTQKFTKSPVKVSINNMPSLASPSKPASSSQTGNSQRSSTIQSRVKNLFRSPSPPPVKTAQGYGKYTDDGKRESVKSAITTSAELIMPRASLPPSSIPRHAKSLGAIYNPEKVVTAVPVSKEQVKRSNYKTSTVSGKQSTGLSSSVVQGKRKPPPPPKPKKPEYLKSPGKLGSETFLDDDLEVLEKRFERKFPGVV